MTAVVLYYTVPCRALPWRTRLTVCCVFQVRELKSAKAEKATVDAEVKALLALKAEFKKATGQDWKPGMSLPAAAAPAPAAGGDGAALSQQVAAQGDKVRQLKAAKADKATVDAAVKVLLALKADYKTATGQDWKPGAAPAPAAPAPAAAPAAGSGSGADLQAQIDAQGAKVRDLKSRKAAKAEVDAEVASLLALKKAFKELTGQDPAASGGGRTPKKPAAEKKPAEKKPADKKAEKKPADKKAAVGDDAGPKKQTRLCLEAKKEEALSDWYSQVGRPLGSQ